MGYKHKVNGPLSSIRIRKNSKEFAAEPRFCQRGFLANSLVSLYLVSPMLPPDAPDAGGASGEVLPTHPRAVVDNSKGWRKHMTWVSH